MAYNFLAGRNPAEITRDIGAMARNTTYGWNLHLTIYDFAWLSALSVYLFYWSIKKEKGSTERPQ